MANIDLKRFVDINIKQHSPSVVAGTRDTIVLFTQEGSNNTTVTVSSYDEAEEQLSSLTNTLAYLSVYFANGGLKAKVIQGIAIGSLTNDRINALENEEIIIAYVSTNETRESVYSSLKTLATQRAASSTVYGINEKIILASTTSTADNSKVKNFIVKYSSVQGAEMTIAAYLSKINVYAVNSIFDYMFTEEVIAPENITDSTYSTIVDNNLNVDVNLANSVRNCGGNCKDGIDVTNNYVRIILHQTLTQQLINLLVTKIKNQTGIAQIYSTIISELERYKVSGYLTTDKSWQDDTLNVVYNGVTYTIVEKGTPLTNGYIVSILPFNALSEVDKAQRKAPPIYIVIADQYGIRKITIDGEVI